MTAMHLLTHKRVHNLHMSKYRVASYITPAGNPVGDFLDDLTNRTSLRILTSSGFYSPLILAKIGGWPRSQDVSSIIGIAVYTGDIVDAVEVTYKVKGSATPVTVRHGGKGGKETLKFELNGNILFLSCNQSFNSLHDSH
jgi:hypothetical protein